ncbi:hypothetical protein [Kytococcus sedentarius]|uniref:hypothetical protein n=1 Tax=Kytococcus sedentarius TaxID=1276 RepID=UPI001364CBBB|nr:hypothetical protein [Kytococcus sedentarius]
MTDMDMVMAAIFVIGTLGLATVCLWQDWRTNTREFREVHRRLLQKQEERRRREAEEQR